MNIIDDKQSAPELILSAWMEANIGPVQKLERQGRWRPCWFVDVMPSGSAEMLKLFVRGKRPGNWPPMPLRYESEVFQIFEAGGLRVPHVHGFIPDLPGIVMDFSRGRTDLKTAASDDDRSAIRGQLIDQMILMHRVDPRPFEAAGAPRPENDNEAALTYYRQIEQLFLGGRATPSPAAEFVRRWLNRNVPINDSGVRPVAVDAAQFLFEGRELTAMLDFEFAGLGDYHTDLAALRIRNRAEYIGDVDEMIRLYAARSGLQPDANRIRYHTAMIAILTPLQVARELAQPTAEIDYHEYIIWEAFCVLIALDCIAEIRGWHEPDFQPSGAPAPSRQRLSIDALALSVAHLPAADNFVRYRQDKQVRVLRYLSLADTWRDTFNEDYLTDAAAVLSDRPANWQEADRQLEAAVTNEDEAQEEFLLRLFTRRYLRQCFLLADPEDKVNYEQITTRMLPLTL